MRHNQIPMLKMMRFTIHRFKPCAPIEVFCDIIVNVPFRMPIPATLLYIARKSIVPEVAKSDTFRLGLFACYKDIKFQWNM